MADVYRQLAKKLDKLPIGFPATSSGVELRILKKIFSPDDARSALKLKPIPETADRIAKRFGLPVDAMRAQLDRMASLGQIGSFTAGGVQRYALLPFIVGIYEFQLNRIDKELADLFEEYAPRFVKSLGSLKPALARVIPVNVAVDSKLEILAYEDMRKIIEGSKSFALRECICRKEKALEGHPCSHTLETCLGFSSEEGAFDYFNYSGRIISKEEALQLLEMTEREGLVHATFNVRENHGFVCNCCSCCCGFLRGLKEFQAPYVLTRSNLMASIDHETCSDCGLCANERCPMQAIAGDGGNYQVMAERCIGCGVCSLACPTDSIRLVRRPQAEQDIPPKNIVHWSVERLAGRSGPLKRMALRMWLARQPN
jgi:Na+-translocating ferredoxin:NAD+ oxidoreductase subunit B